MKKIFALILTALLLTVGMVVCSNAAEYVYYENDFSDSATLGDFTQYRGEWAIEDGVLKLTGADNLPFDGQAFLLYTADSAVMNLTDYVFEMDMISAMVPAGVLVRCNTNYANGNSDNEYFGYEFAFGKNMTSFDYTATNGDCSGIKNLFTSSAFASADADAKMEADYNIRITVQGTSVNCVITDNNVGTEVYNNTVDSDMWAMGSFGVSAIIADMSGSGATNFGSLAFDNLKVTAIGEVGDHLASGKALADFVPAMASAALPAYFVPEEELDMTMDEYIIYETDFSDEAVLNDFTQLRGEWVVKDGGLYFVTPDKKDDGSDVTFSFAMLTKEDVVDALTNKYTDYVVEADFCNIQTSCGIVTHADTELMSADSDNSFCGYLTFFSNDAKKLALGLTKKELVTDWGGNLHVSSAISSPNGSYRMRAEHKEGKLIGTVLDLEGNTIYTFAVDDGVWSAGTVGLRMRGVNGESINLDTAYIDNLKISIQGDRAILLNNGKDYNAAIKREVVEKDETAGNKGTSTEVAQGSFFEVATEATNAVTVATPGVNADNSNSGGVPVILIAVVAAVVVAAVVVAIVLSKKRK